jgi:hypothetical protein
MSPIASEPPLPPLKTALSRAYGAYHRAVRASVRPQMMGWVCTDVLDGIDTLATTNPASPVVLRHQRLTSLLADQQQLFESKSLRDEFKRVYDEAEAITFPAATAYKEHSQYLQKWTRNWSLVWVRLDRLRALDLKAHSDPTFAQYISDMKARLPDIADAPNVAAYSQFFERYSEALVLELLRSKNLPTERVPEEKEKSKNTPDFKCRLEGDRTFFVEVKTLDIVGGEFRQDEMMVDAIDSAVDLERQEAEGKRIAMTESEIAPFKRYGETDTYDSRSLMRVIDTIREKSFQAFKPAQFTKGPTLALAVHDRLGTFHSQYELAPYYPNHQNPTNCESGVLWHAAFGRLGTPIFRQPEFEGKPGLEGHLSAFGIFVDPGRRFPGLAFINVMRARDTDVALACIPTTMSS